MEILISIFFKLSTVTDDTQVDAVALCHGFAHGGLVPEGGGLSTYVVGFSIAIHSITLVGRGWGP
ncbi:HupE/UreJ family protein [Marinobacter vinifirmus]|uniref:HupE/UreJ family protein n=1 Tax=Marinobacter vinifirmus TaxID=355591 RepID=UPI003B5BF41D